MPMFEWQSSTLKEGIFQDNLIKELKMNKEFKVTKGTHRYIDDAKRKDGELMFYTNNSNYYLTMEFKRDTTFNLLSNIAQTIHYEYQASDGGNDPLMENYGGIIVCPSIIVFFEYCKLPELLTDLYSAFATISTTAASKIYSENASIRNIMEKYESKLRNNCVFYHLDQYQYYTPIFENIVKDLKNRLN